MSISTPPGSSFYWKFMQLLTQEKQNPKSTFKTAAKQAEAISSSEITMHSQTQENPVSAVSLTDTIQISEQGRAYMQIRMSAETSFLNHQS